MNRYYKKDVWIIDVSQSVEIDHPNALFFLRNDCKNVTDYFSKYKKSDIDTFLGNKVDVEAGKGLSANDFTNELKAKLDGIEEGATATTIDDALSDTSENPVQNKIIKTALDDKVNVTDTLVLNCTL